MAAELTLRALEGIPLVVSGDDPADLVLAGMAPHPLKSGDVFVLAQKIVSKAEGRQVDLASVTPSPRARELGLATDKDPRLVELILSESSEVLRVRRGILIVVHRLGFVCANAGIDQSNVSAGALLLPKDPDRSCRQIRQSLFDKTGIDVAVLIIDSLGRAWRNGTIGTALGVSGLPGLLDLRGVADLYGRELQTTEIGMADELAAAASLIMGQAAEGRPIVLARGVPYARRDGSAAELLRPLAMDLFR
jgi:coenzyme F420-0:L-glutamate ligase/coenzyme F420-1:gamma-L-glutamate ligase